MLYFIRVYVEGFVAQRLLYTSRCLIAFCQVSVVGKKHVDVAAAEKSCNYLVQSYYASGVYGA